MSDKHIITAVFDGEIKAGDVLYTQSEVEALLDKQVEACIDAGKAESFTKSPRQYGQALRNSRIEVGE